MLNPSFKRRSPPPIILIIIGSAIFACSVAHPAHRRTFSLVDRLVRANPLRALANYFSRKFSLDLYYPPYPAKSFMSGNGMRSSSSWQPIYYMPPVPMASMAMMAPGTGQHQHLPFQHQHPFQGEASYYPMTAFQQQSPIFKQAEPTYQPVNQLIEHSQPLMEQHDSNFISTSPPPGDNQVMPSPSLPFQYTDDEPKDEGLLQLLPPPVEYSVEDSNSAGNSQSVRIFVIRQSDLQKMKNMEHELSTGEVEHSSPDMVKEYDMKYVVGGEDGMGASSEAVLNSNIHIAPIDSDSPEKPCVEPMCDPFLRKLIPELLPSSSSFQHDIESKKDDMDEPIVIVKSDNNTLSTDYSVSYLNNFKKPETKDQLGAESSVQSNRVHFPRRKLLSAKINSTSLRKVKAQVPTKLPPSNDTATNSSRKNVIRRPKKLNALVNNRSRSSLPKVAENKIPNPRIFMLNIPSLR